MAKGKITKVISDKEFFFIDKDYFCRNSAYKNIPKVDDIVEYEPFLKDGKKAAKNVKFIKKGILPLDEYFEELEDGYFSNIISKNLKPQLIIHYPQQLAELFQKDNNINKSTQIRKYFDSCRLIEGKYKINKDFEFVISELLKLVPLINNAKGKKLISDDFFNFFEYNIAQAIKSEDHFRKGFIPHFESLIGYYKH